MFHKNNIMKQCSTLQYTQALIKAALTRSARFKICLSSFIIIYHHVYHRSPSVDDKCDDKMMKVDDKHIFIW
jgi:hypothetical protein